MKTNIYNKVHRTVRLCLPLFLMVFLPLLAACDHIDENDRLIEVKSTTPEEPTDDKPTTVTKNVLLEDFTGQRCSNCPTGTEVIEQLLEAYGERLIAVGIHGGPLGFKGTPTVLGLATDLGDTYFNYWQLEYQPVGLIDRHGAVNYTDWITAVRTEMEQTSGIKMTLDATLKDGQIAISITEECLGNNYSGKLQVWVLEDSITALQTMPDGKNNRDYVHNHVLRTTVNGTWGEDFQATTGETKTQSLAQTIDPEWNSANLSVIAFVYNDNGVEQVVKASVKAASDLNDK